AMSRQASRSSPPNDPASARASPPADAEAATAAAAAGDSATPPQDGPPLVCKAPVDATVEIPKKVGVVEGSAVPPQELGAGMELHDTDEVFTEFTGDLTTAMRRPGFGYMLPAVTLNYFAFCMMRAGMNEDQPP